jgi:hypothetical protein
LAEWFKSPEAKAQLAPLRRAIGARWQKRMEEWKGEVRAGVLKVLEIADAIAGKL